MMALQASQRETGEGGLGATPGGDCGVAADLQVLWLVPGGLLAGGLSPRGGHSQPSGQGVCGEEWQCRYDEDVYFE